MPKQPVPHSKLTLRELSSEELPSLFPLLAALNPALKKPVFQRRLKAMLPLGYRAVAAFDGARMVGISGFWIGMRFWCGKQFDIDNFVVDPEYRGRKTGECLMEWLEKKALSEKCDLMVLDVLASNHLAHRFYHRAGFVITGYHFTKIPGSLEPWQKQQA